MLNLIQRNFQKNHLNKISKNILYSRVLCSSDIEQNEVLKTCNIIIIVII